MALRSFDQVASPPAVLNLTGPELLHVRETCEKFELFGPPRVSAEQLIAWVAAWLLAGGPTLNKPTHFEARDGRF